jgi:hypothetical protein
LAEGQGNPGREGGKMTIPQIGETVKYLRTTDLFQVKKVTPKFIVLNSQDGLTQIMTPTESLDLVFERIPAAESFPLDLTP